MEHAWEQLKKVTSYSLKLLGSSEDQWWKFSFNTGREGGTEKGSETKRRKYIRPFWTQRRVSREGRGLNWVNCKIVRTIIGANFHFFFYFFFCRSVLELGRVITNRSNSRFNLFWQPNRSLWVAADLHSPPWTLAGLLGVGGGGEDSVHGWGLLLLLLVAVDDDSGKGWVILDGSPRGAAGDDHLEGGRLYCRRPTIYGQTNVI